MSFEMDDAVRLVADAQGDPSHIPMLLLHGGGQSRLSWRDAGGKFAQAGYRSVALDQRGHGDSDWSPGGDYRLERFAADIRSICAGFDQPPMLVGASLGGLAGAMALGELPAASARGLVLADVAHRPDMDGARRILSFMIGRTDGFASLDEAADAIAAYLPHRPRPKPASIARALRSRPDGRLRWHWDPAFAEIGRPRALHFDTDRIVAGLRGICVPILLVRGGSSEIVSPEIAAEFRAILPQATYLDIPGVGHMVASADNGAFTSAVLDFAAAVR